VRRAFAISFATISVVAFACDEFSESETPASDAGTGETSTTIDAANDVAITDGGIDATPPVPAPVGAGA
jgi:hypothetical protein